MSGVCSNDVNDDDDNVEVADVEQIVKRTTKLAQHYMHR